MHCTLPPKQTGLLGGQVDIKVLDLSCRTTASLQPIGRLSGSGRGWMSRGYLLVTLQLHKLLSSAGCVWLTAATCCTQNAAESLVLLTTEGMKQARGFCPFGDIKASTLADADGTRGEKDKGPCQGRGQQQTRVRKSIARRQAPSDEARMCGWRQCQPTWGLPGGMPTPKCYQMNPTKVAQGSSSITPSHS